MFLHQHSVKRRSCDYDDAWKMVQHGSVSRSVRHRIGDYLDRGVGRGAEDVAAVLGEGHVVHEGRVTAQPPQRPPGAHLMDPGETGRMDSINY